MKFDLTKNEASGLNRNVILTIADIRINAQENLLDKSGKVAFKGETQSLSINGGPGMPMGIASEEATKNTANDAALEIMKTKVLQAYAEYYQIINP